VVLERGSLDAGVTIAVDARDGTRVDADAVIERLALRRPRIDGDAVSAPAIRILVRDLHHRPGSIVLRYASAEGNVTVLDPLTTPPRRLTFSDFTATASGLEAGEKTLSRIALHANVPGGGEVDVGGTAGLQPRRADLRVRARGVELATLARYLPLAGTLDGIARVDARVVASHERELVLTVTGETTLDRVVLGDGARTLAGASRLSATGIAYTWPASLRVDRLTATQPSVTVERDAAGAIGLAALVRPPAPPASASPTPAPAATVDVRIARLQVDDGRAVVSDAASGTRLEPRRIAVTAEDLTWPARGPARVRASASLGGTEVSTEGSVDTGGRSAELALRVRGVDLALLQPWLPIAGRVRGAADADLRVVAAHDGALRLTVSGDTTLHRVALLDGSQRLATAARIAATGAEYTWPATVRIGALTVTQPSATLERDAQGAINLAAVLGRAAPAEGGASAGTDPAAAVDIRVASLQIDDGRAAVSDAASGGRVEVGRLALTAGDLTWPVRGESRLRLAASVAGGDVTVAGTVDLAQRRGELALTLRGADLTALQPWLPIVGRIRGTAHANVTLAGTLDAPIVRGSVGAADLGFLLGDEALLTVGRVDVTALNVEWPARLTIEQLRVDAPWAKVARNTDGALSLRALFGPRAGRPAGPVQPSSPGPIVPGPIAGLQATVRNALFENGSATIVDDAVEPAARFELRGSRLALRDLTWPARGPAAVELSTSMPGREGTLKARGTFSIEPTRLALEVDLDQVDLAPGRPYLPIDVRLGGRLSGRAKVTGTFGESITLVIDGDATADRLALGDDNRRLATVRKAEVVGLRYQYPTGMRVRQLKLDKPWLLVERDGDGRLELATLLAARRPAATGPAAPTDRRPEPAREPRVRVLIGKLTMDDGFVRFVDRTTNPDYAEELAGITLTADGLGTRPTRRATVAMQGTFASGAPLIITGELGGFMGPRFLDLTLTVSDFPVPRLNPYLDRQLAWVARQGMLVAAVRYRLSGDDLEASNDITLKGLEVDRSAASAERSGPPVDTIVSLLKNREGVIHLNVPVRGSISAPEFDYGDAMWTALRNVAIRLVSLPFSWVGKLFYTADSHIESIQVWPVVFPTAKTTPTVAGGEQLQRLATFLKDSPATRLRLRPVTTVADVTALRREALDTRLGAAGDDPAARRQAAVALYTELFPRRQPPPSDEALLDELTRETPTPPRALRELATGRVAAVRDALGRAGLAAERLEPAESRAAVESEGDPRVEFEITR
jgi:hypothetical protein